jgi:hypothetical protein
MLQDVRGMYRPYGVGGDPFPVRSHTAWIKEPQAVNGKTLETAVIVHGWSSPDTEKEVKGCSEPMDRWRSKLESLGRLSLEEHFDFTPAWRRRL